MEVLKLYKREEGEERRELTISVTLRCRNSDLTNLLVGVGISRLGEEWYLGLARQAGS